jgi:hypothetical protein
VALRAIPTQIVKGKPQLSDDESRLRIFERLGYQLVDTQQTFFTNAR